MTKLTFRRRVAGSVLAGALAVTAVGPAAAQRLPVSGDFVQPLTDQVRYKRAKRRGGNEAAAAALILGAAALGVAAIAASRQNRQRTYYVEEPYAGYGYASAYRAPQVHRAQYGYYAPQGYYQQPQGYYQQPQGYYRQPQYYQPAPPPQRGYYQQRGYPQAYGGRVYRQPPSGDYYVDPNRSTEAGRPTLQSAPMQVR